MKDNRLAWGISLLLFGVMFLLRQLGIFSPEIADVLFDFKNFPLIIGVIFLIWHKNKSIGMILIVVGLLLRLQEIIHWTQNLSEFVWPLLLIAAGIILLFGVKKGK
ncbi:MAG TPA: DUF5668 domain-containing protein [Paludibacteraceae bacterium]|jgi:uncharacterized membrane protein|nr:DUF5668 domain-containing protein [Paludibacteraceae bacterium]HPS10694.1 DUF5668 domain-containing protein [Paludibacteraceae bacterium]